MDVENGHATEAAGLKQPRRQYEDGAIELALGEPARGSGAPDATPFHLEVTSEKGTLRLEVGAIRGFQSGRLRLFLKRKAQSVDECGTAAMPDTAANVAGVYAALREDTAEGATPVPGFDPAVRLSRLVEDVCTSRRDGRAQASGGLACGMMDNTHGDRVCALRTRRRHATKRTTPPSTRNAAPEVALACGEHT